MCTTERAFLCCLTMIRLKVGYFPLGALHSGVRALEGSTSVEYSLGALQTMAHIQLLYP